MAEHTPTPWSAGSQWIFTYSGYPLPIASGYQHYVTSPGGYQYDAAVANAAFIVKACNAHEALLAENERLRLALKPFVVLANTVFEKYETGPGEFKEAYSDKPDDHSVWGFNMVSMTYGHLRAARKALSLSSAERATVGGEK